MRRDIDLVGGVCDRCAQYEPIVRWFSDASALTEPRGLCTHCLRLVVAEHDFEIKDRPIGMVLR